MRLFPSIRLSPLMQKRLQNFLRIRRASRALVLLAVFFGLSLISELICNSKPLYLRVNGKSHFPFAQRLTHKAVLGDGPESPIANYHAFTADPAFAADPRNKAIWAPVRYSPGDVIDPASLEAYKTVRVSIVPEAHVGRINLTPDHTVIRALRCEPFFPGVDTPDGQRLDAHWQLPDALRQELTRRFAGEARDAAAFTLVRRDAPSATARVTLPETRATALPPPSVRLTFRQAEALELPSQIRFRLQPDGTAAPLDKRLWANVPEASRPPILQMAAAAFAGTTAADQPVAWNASTATVSSAVTAIAWPFPPVKGHWMGIDAAGRDVFSRVLYGMRIAMIFGILLALWAMAFGMVFGSIQGYFGGKIDIAGQRVTEIWSALPFLYVMIFVGAALGRSFWLLLLCYGLFNWLSVSYYMRAEFLRLRSRTFIEAARCQGLSAPRIIFGHILPNALTPLITLFPFSLVGSIGSLAALDFLGFGLPPLTPSWGELLQQAQQFRWAWWLILFPSLALFTVMLLTVFVGEGVRDAFDPRQHSKME